jgi:hypothetical protein
MAAKVSDRVQQLVTQAAELPPAELVALAEAIDSLLRRDDTVADRHAVIAERIARVHAGEATTLSMEEVERTVRDELDFWDHMAIRVLPEARSDLGDAIRHYRAVKPPAVGKQLATRVLDAFKQAVASVESMPLSRPEHPDIPGALFGLRVRTNSNSNSSSPG